MTENTGKTVLFPDVVGEKDAAGREELIEKLIAQMTLDEKISLMGGAAKLSDSIHYGSSIFVAGGCERLGIPQVRFTDGPRGMMLENATCFPVSMARGATWDPELERRVGSAIGVEARERGANLVGSVCINLLRHPAWGRAQETYGEDPYHVGEMGAAQTRGLQKHIMACVKHFAANSIENSRFWVDVRIDDRTLMEVYLPHFKKCVDAGAASVMGAYNRLNGFYCCHNKRLLTDILKGVWGFDGFAISDWTFAVRGSDAAAAGLDIEMPNAIFFGLPLRFRAMTGRIGKERIDDAVTRIVRQLSRFHPDGNNKEYTGKVACDEHTGLALEVARKSVVLLKNDRAVLPLADAGRIAVVGELAAIGNIGDTGGSSRMRPPYVVSVLEGIRKRAAGSASVEYSDGKNLEKVREAARAADAVVVVAGLKGGDEGEFFPFVTHGGDRSSLALSKNHVNMIKAAAGDNKNCVVVLEGGSALAMENWIDDAAAVLMVWYPGMEGGRAVAEALFGDVNPGGKLPITFPRSENQLPPFNKWTRKIKYEYLHGYRHFDKYGHEPLFSFGYGLSYTRFEFDNIRVIMNSKNGDETIIVTCEITNAGTVRGEEVVQLYVGYPESKVERPVKELKGFIRVEMEPGETQEVSFEIQPEELAYYDVEPGVWKTEAANYEVCVGSSSREKDLPLRGAFKIARELVGGAAGIQPDKG